MPSIIRLTLKLIEASSKFYVICPKVDQVVYALDTICMPDIMVLAQALDTICMPDIMVLAQALDTICMPDIMVLAQAVLHLFCCFNIQNAEVGKGR